MVLINKMSPLTIFYEITLLSLNIIMASPSSDSLYFKPTVTSNDQNQNHAEGFKQVHHDVESLTHHDLAQTCGPQGGLPFWNTSLSWEERVNDLVARLTLEEIQLQMARGGAGPYSTPAPPIMRLGD